MTILTKTTAKTLYETGDIPTGTDFSNWIDSCVFIPANVTAGSFPFLVEVESTVSSTARTIGTIGKQLIGVATTASAASLFSLVTAGTFGALLIQEDTEASALSFLNISGVGRQIAQSIVTASAQNAIGMGAVGKQIVETSTTASAAQLFVRGKTPIQTVSGNAFANVSLAVSGYAYYEVQIDRMNSENHGVQLVARFSRDGGSTYDSAGYRWNIREIDSSTKTAAVTVQSTGGNDHIKLMFGLTGPLPTSANGVAGTIKIFDAPSSARNTMILSDLMYEGVTPGTAAATATQVAVRSVGMNNTAATINAIQLFFGASAAVSSAVKNASVKLYGYNRQ